MLAFQKMITDNKDKVPVKTGDESYDFQAEVGTAIYSPYFYISTPAQNAIARGINTEFRRSINKAGYLTPELDDVENDPEGPTCQPCTELMPGALGIQAMGTQAIGTHAIGTLALVTQVSLIPAFQIANISCIATPNVQLMGHAVKVMFSA